MQVLVRHERVNLLVMQVLGLLDNLFIKRLIEMWNDAEGALESVLQLGSALGHSRPSS